MTGLSGKNSIARIPSRSGWISMRGTCVLSRHTFCPISRPFLVRPDSPAHLSARAESASSPRIRRLAASAPPSSKGPIGPGKTAARRRRRSRRRNRGGFGFGGGGFANPGIGGLPEAFDARRPLSRKGDPRDDAAIGPANGTPARQRDPEEGARLSAGVRRPRPAPPRARPMRPAAQRGDGAFGAVLHGPRRVRECGIVPVENAQLAVADPPSARARPPPWRSRRRRRRRRGGA